MNSPELHTMCSPIPSAGILAFRGYPVRVGHLSPKEKSITGGGTSAAVEIAMCKLGKRQERKRN